MPIPRPTPYLKYYNHIGVIGVIMKKRFSITMDERVLKAIDKERGLIPRSAYIESKLKKVLGIG